MASTEEEYLLRLRKAAVSLGEMRARLDALEDARTEPIAIVGMACRFPGGVDSPEAFWKLLEGGTDAITELPKDRHSARPAGGAAVERDDPGARWGGFLTGIDLFEPEFFGIPPREAQSMDPQQRLLLEVAWEALEHAGIVPSQLMGSDTGVFLGILNDDYMQICMTADPDSRNVYDFTGNGHPFPAGRLSYTLGLQGPCIAVDTACSSSLVAVHLACQSLRSGESKIAIAGGVNLMLSPRTSQLLEDGSVFASDGKCKTFDARADGFVRGEGCGIVVLKRLSDAKADSGRILALIRGSAVNQDGRSSGLTAPSTASQTALIRRALENARVPPSEIGYVEAHGTGTALGDPIEFDALRAVLGAPRESRSPCALGAVKTNIGHTEAAAGVAGLIKTVLALQNGAIPPNLHFRQLNPRISLEDTPFLVPTTKLEWKPDTRPRFAGVSSFGMSGTNAHVVLEEAPRAGAASAPPDDEIHILPLSARSGEALRALAQAYHHFFTAEARGESCTVRDMAFTACVGRSALEQRLALVGRSRGDFGAALDAFLRGEQEPGLIQGQVTRASQGQVTRASRPKVAFIFPGYGSQSIGMGRRLLDREPVFRAAIEACDAAIQKEAGWSLLSELSADEQRSQLARADVIQPVLFSIEVALAAQWRDWGVEPDVVVGHSLGEIAAAHVAGALSLDDAVKVVCLRGRLIRRVSGQGATALVELSLAQAEAALSGYEDRLWIAGSNSPRSTVLSGDTAALEEVIAKLTQEQVFCRHVKMDFASHSPQMDPLRGELVEALAGLAPRAASVLMCSTVTGEPIGGEELNATYWGRNVREPVLFWRVIEKLIEQDYSALLEISPHPILLPSINEGLRDSGRGASGLPSLRHGEDDRAAMLKTLGALYTMGYAVDFKRLYPEGGRIVSLPTYPWQRERYWVKPAAHKVHGGASRVAPGGAPQGHPLLGRRMTSSVDPSTHFWEPDLTAGALAYLKDHRVEGTPVLPGAAFVEMALAAGEAALGAAASELKDVSFRVALALDEPQRTQVVVTASGDGSALFRCSSQAEATGGKSPDWVLLATAKLVPPRPQDSGRSIDLASLQSRCTEVVAAAQHYEAAARVGIDYGPSFTGVVELRRGAGRAVARVQLPEELTSQASEYKIHPALLDACFQVVLALLPRDKEPWLPIGIAAVRVHRRPEAEVWVHAEVKGTVEARMLRGEMDLVLVADDGQVLIEVEGLEVRRLEAWKSGTTELDSCTYELTWEPQPLLADTAGYGRRSETYILCGDFGAESEGRTDLCASLASALEAAGNRCVRVSFGERYERHAQNAYRVSPGDPAGYKQLLADLATGAMPPLRGVVHAVAQSEAAPLALDAIEHAQQRGYDSILGLVQALLGAGVPDGADPPRLWLVTRGVPGIDAAAGARGLAQAPVWGLGRVIAQEHPALRCSCVDLGALTISEATTALSAELLADGREDQIALARDKRRVARLVRREIRRGEALSRMPRPRHDGTYLITGGLGGIGLLVAQWLASQGARHLVLIGRSAGSAAANEAVERMRRDGVEVRIALLDVANRGEVAALLREVTAEMPPLRAVHHLAGSLDDGMLQQQTPQRLRKVMASKVFGTCNLHELTAGAPLESFVLYSSITALLGSPGQGNYAAVNAFLDAFAHYRSSLGLPALSVNWGAWSEVGMAAASDDRGQRIAQRGMGGITSAQGMEILARLLGSGRVQLAAVLMDWPKWFEHNPVSAEVRLLSAFRETPSLAAAAPVERGKALRNKLRSAPEDTRLPLVLSYLQGQIATLLGVPASRLDVEGPLNTLGLDSLMGTELKARIGMDLGATVPLQLVRGPSIEKLAQSVIQELAKSKDASDTAPAAPEARAAEGPSQAAIAEAPTDPFDVAIPQVIPAPRDLYEPFPLAELQLTFFMARGEAFEHHVGSHLYSEAELEDFDIQAYEEAFRRVIARHPLLRTLVLPDELQLRVLAEVPPFTIPVRDLRSLPPDKAAAALATIREEMSHREAPITTWPTLELRATRLDARRTVLHFNVNSLFLDAWSANIVFEEVAHIYRNPRTMLPRIEFSFRDYVLTLPRIYESELGQRSRAYWRARLPNLPSRPQLPLRSGVDTYRRSRTSRRLTILPAAVWRLVKEAAHAHGVTPSTLMFAAFAEVVGAFCNSQHFILNLMIMNRMPVHPQVGLVVGNFAMLLPLEVDLRRATTLVGHAQQIQEQLTSDLDHRYAGGLWVMQELNRQLGRTTRAPAPVVVASGLHLKPFTDPLNPFSHPPAYCLETPQTWIDNDMFEVGDGALAIAWDVIEEIFPAGFMDAMWSANLRRIQDVVERTGWDAPPPVFVPPEQLARRAEINTTERPVSQELIHTLFARTAEARPDHLAIISSSGNVTYGQLSAYMHRIGRKLRELGARPNELVAVIMEKGWEQAAAALGILAAGAAYVPMEPSLPTERLNYLLANAEVRFALTQRGVQQIEWPSNVQRLLVDGEDFEGVDASPLPPVQRPEDLAYVIYTSGSTGSPKGVMIDHRGVVNTVQDICERFAIGPGDRVFGVSSLSFDLSVFDIFGPLIAGATLVLPAPSATRDPNEWLAQCHRDQVTVWNSAPQLMQLLVDAGEGKASLPSLRLILLSGDWIAVSLPDQVRSLCPNGRVISLGGATEASIWSIIYPIERVDPSWKSIPYGTPLENQRWHVLSDEMKPCPTWVPGQLYIGGAGLAKGYWRDDAKTQASFVTHPITGERLYRTGDMGRYLPDGTIEFLGRQDFQVKIHGFRVELGEVESALQAHPDVREAVVVVRSGGVNAKRLVAYVVPVDATHGINAGELQAFLQKKLPEYMVPAVYIAITALPLSSNGKLDRSALPDTGELASEGEVRYVAPRDELEQGVAQIWEEVLGVHPVGLHDDFFALGGQSFSAIRMVVRLQQRFGRRLELASVLRLRTVEHLADLLRKPVPPLSAWTPLVPISVGGKTPPLFLVHPAGGNVLCYAELARHLGSDQGVYGLQAAGLSGAMPPVTRVEAMAQRYIGAIQGAQLAGPYLLGGWSSGGVVAYEMARQLEGIGQRVEAVILLDAPAPLQHDAVDNALLIRWFLEDLAVGFPIERLSMDALRQVSPGERLDFALDQMGDAHRLPSGLDREQLRAIFGVFKGVLIATRSYDPTPIASPLFILRASEERVEEFTGHPAGDALDWGWRSVGAMSIETASAPGSHYTMLTPPNAGTVATLVRRFLEGLRGRR